MRINLVTPFAEKDAAKALGARWDSAKKVWYIDGVSDLTPFARWIPDLPAAAGASTGLSAPPTAKAGPVTARRASGTGGAVTTRPTVSVPHCGCDVLPWEHCVHTGPTA